MDLRCPYCGNENTTRVPVEIIDQSVKSTWWMIIIFGILGISVNPLILILAFASMAINIIINIVLKHRHRNEWVMQCPRCKHQFTVPNPDRTSQIAKEKEKRETKDAQNREKQEQKKEIRLEKSRQETAVLVENSRLYDDETLLSEVDYFATHKNAWSSAGGTLRITNKSLLIYNKRGAFRIYKDQTIGIKKKNYCFMIPTGIQIITDDGKKHKYNFVVCADKRKQIIKALNSWFAGEPVEQVH